MSIYYFRLSIYYFRLSIYYFRLSIYYFRLNIKSTFLPRWMTCRESRALVHHAQRCVISDVMPLVRGGMGHRLSVITWLTAEQAQRRLNIKSVSTRAVEWGGDANCHRFGEGNVLWLQSKHRAHSHPVFEVIERFIGWLDLKLYRNDCHFRRYQQTSCN